jgi:pyruvate/2-oxoglutarate dehydrogenase complex dihydrolipoamide dehydrogenase (E3) component
VSQSTNPALVPDDMYNRALLESVHPPEWRNPEASERYNLVVVGAGTAGLVSAAGAAGLGAKVALVERHLTGGDCLNYGCVPSKSLLRAARAAQAARAAHDGTGFGVHAGPVRIDFGEAMSRMRRVRAEIAPGDSVQRFAALGVDVFLGDARFVAPDEIAVGGQRLRFA